MRLPYGVIRTPREAQQDPQARLNGFIQDLTLETGVVAVVPGTGNRRLFESYGATRVIEGGQTMNPSTADRRSRPKTT